MKRIISNVMLVAAAAMAFFACQKQEINAPEEVKVEGLNFSAEKPEFADVSKTEWTDSEIHWSKGDAIRVAYTCNGVWQNADGTADADEDNGKKTAKLYASTTLAAASATAKFAVPGDFKGEASGVYEFYAIYPSGAAVKKADFPYAPSVTVDLPAEQTPLSTSFDSAADLMAAKSIETFAGLPTESISLLWTRIVAHGHLTIKNLQVEEGEKLHTITLTADKDADMVGEHYLYLDTHDVEKAAGNNAANSLTVKANNLTIAEGKEGGDVTFWACFLPCTWKSLDVVVETDKATYTRSIDLTGKEKTFKQNARNTLAINMATAEREAKTSQSLPFVRDFSGMSDSSDSSEITELDGFSSIDGKVYNADNAIRLASGNVDGSITTQPLDLSQNFHVIVTACGWDSGELKMTVSAGEQTENITLTTYGADQKPGTWKDYVINFDPVGPTASVQFSAVKDTRYYIKKIQILEGHAELTPVLAATNPGEMSAEGGEGSFTYTLSNPKDGKTVEATADVDWIEILEVDQVNKTVSYSVAENTSEESRTATITLSYEDAQSVNVTVTQEGKSAEGGEAELVWTLVTDASTLAVGDQIVIVASSSNYALGATQNDNNRNAVSVTKSGNTVVIGNTVQIITLETGSVSNTFAFNTGTSGYLYAASSSNNYLRTKTTLDANGSWSISITTAGVATIKANGTYTRNLLKKNSSSALFSCYGSGQSDVSIYRLEGGESGGETPEPEQPTLTPRNLAFSSEIAEATMGQVFTEPILSGETSGVTYSSLNTDVATVNSSTGAITLVAAGTTTITATAPATDKFEAGIASYTLTVNAAPASSKKTYTLTISASDFNGSSYDANNNTKTSTAKATDGSEISVSWVSYQVMLQSNAMQWQKSKGYIYNITDLGTIKSIKVNNTAGSFTQYIGASQKPTSNGSGGYFHIKTGSSAVGKTSSVVITFEK